MALTYSRGLTHVHPGRRNQGQMSPTVAWVFVYESNKLSLSFDMIMCDSTDFLLGIMGRFHRMRDSWTSVREDVQIRKSAETK
jgi:hypothetical protein